MIELSGTIYLEAIMRKLRFAERWISWAMFCVKTVHYFVLVNGEPYGHIIPTGVLGKEIHHQHIFFILCADLSSLLRHAEEDKSITAYHCQGVEPPV
jgi:hypothetical protein